MLRPTPAALNERIVDMCNGDPHDAVVVQHVLALLRHRGFVHLDTDFELAGYEAVADNGRRELLPLDRLPSTPEGQRRFFEWARPLYRRVKEQPDAGPV